MNISSSTTTYLDVSEAATRLGCAPITIRRLVSDKAIEHVRIGARGGRILFTQAMLDDFLARRTVRPLAQAA
jgi:excisionase family DNA binding protein